MVPSQTTPPDLERTPCYQKPVKNSFLAKKSVSGCITFVTFPAILPYFFLSFSSKTVQL
jgi:hypothetical protein